MNSYKLLTILFVFSLLFGTLINLDNIDDTIQLIENKAQHQQKKLDKYDDAMDTQGNTASDESFDKTPGNIFLMGGVIWDIVWDSFFGMPKRDSNSPIEFLFILPLIIFRTLLGIIIIVWLFDKFKNKASG